MELVQQFKAPRKSLGDIDAEATATLIAAAADVALVIDREGIIRDVAFGSNDLALEGYSEWLGQSWLETVTVESRTKIDMLLREAGKQAISKPRQLNHPSTRGTADVPVLYSVVQIGQEGRVVALGRDLRKMAALQQRLLDAQQSIEREYQRLRQAETRYRLLFHMASEAVLILDADSQKVMEANPAAGKLMGAAARQLIGRIFPEGLDKGSAQQVQGMLNTVRAAGRADDMPVLSADGTREYLISASLFRQDNASYFLVRLSALRGEPGAATVPKLKSKLLEVVEMLPDGFVVVNPAGEILTANRAFLDFVQLTSEEQVRGEHLERWFGRANVELDVVMNNLRANGSLRMFPTVLRGEFESVVEVEVAAVSVPSGDTPCFGFTFRPASNSESAKPAGAPHLPKSIAQLSELVGRVPLKDLVQETTDVIERMCIEAALELTGDNRASAAEMLGLSRQSLYVKLRRHGLGDLNSEGDTPES
ncbi:MAG: transcriptional regulator PpsR [Burkholderiales bacterium]|nr:transcriptional regulator PpsR [Burkholderiales bacterium]